MQFRIEQFEAIDSTNTAIKEALDQDEPEGLVVRSLTQSGGYGRQGRMWASPFGGLYQSILLRPSVNVEMLPTIGLVSGLAAARAIERFIDSQRQLIAIKWPNDCLIDERKLVGISCESHSGGVCLGIGVNVFKPSKEEHIAGKNTPVYLEELACFDANERQVIESLGDCILNEFQIAYLNWENHGFSYFKEDFFERNFLLGKTIELKLMNGATITTGIVRDVDECGRLVVQMDEGIKPYLSGEVHILSANEASIST